MKYRVKNELQIRSEPSKEQGKIFGILHPGFIIDGTEIIGSEEEDPGWLRDNNGFYYWRGALESPFVTMSIDRARFNLNLKAPWLLENFDISPAWSHTTGRDVCVAIIDTGIFKHEDISENIDSQLQKSFIGSSILDTDGHGTHLAGMIGARGVKNLIGIAPDVKILPIKVVESQKENIDNLRLSHAIDYVTSIPTVDIINLSLKVNQRGPNYNKLTASIQNAISAGKIIVSSSGNDWGDYVTSPAHLEGVLAVSAVKRMPENMEQYQIPLLANYGKRVDTTCIGYDILSCGIDGNTAIKKGTSMAAAYLSGVIALKIQILKEISRSFTPENIREELKNSVFGTAPRENNSNVSLPVLNPNKFLNT